MRIMEINLGPGILLPPEATFNGFLCGTLVKNKPAKAGDTGDTSSIPGLGRSLGSGNTFQDSCLENLMDREA